MKTYREWLARRQEAYAAPAVSETAKQEVAARLSSANGLTLGEADTRPILLPMAWS